MPTSNDLQRFECFHHHSEAALTAVAAVMRPRTLLAGEPLFRQGESDGGSCFLLCSGCVAVHRKSAEQTRKLATIEPPSTLAEPPGNGSLQAGDVCGAEEGGMPREIQDVADAHKGQPGGMGLSRVERLGRDRVYVGIYVQKKYVRVHAPEDHGEFLYRRTPGTVVGALSALTGCKRYETAVAEIDCTVFEVRKEDYNTWLATKDEKAYASDCLFLRETPCFCLLPDSVLVKIAASFQRSSYSSKVDICNQGTTAVAMYVIRSGECEVTRRVKRAAGHDNLQLVNLGRTDLVGHHELLSNTLHSFTVSTRGNVELWALSSETLQALFDSHVTHTHLHLDTRLIGSGGQLINCNDHVPLEQSPIDRPVRRNAIYSHSGLGVSDGVWKRLKQDLVEHGKRAHAFHKQRAYYAGAARYDPKEQERFAEMSVRKEEQTPQWQAAEAARARERQEKERRAGNLCSSIEQGPALVGQVLNQKVYTRVVKLKPRIHKLLRQPLETTAKSLPHILRKRQQMFHAPEKVDLTSGVDSTPEWMEHIDFPEPFRLADKNLSQREHLIHDKLNYAVNMFDTYASLAMKRLRRLAPKTSKTDARASTTRTARTARSSSTANSPPSIRSLESNIRKATRSPSPTRLATTHTAKSGRSRSSIGVTSALWIDLEGFLSVLEGADLVDRNMQENVIFEHEWEAFGCSPEFSPPFGKDEQTDWRSPELSPPFGKATAASPLSPKQRCIKTKVEEKDVIRTFLAAARRLRNAPGAPDRCIAFEQFLACLRRISADLECPSPPRLQDAERAVWPETPEGNERRGTFTSMAVHVDVPEAEAPIWKSPLLLRESLVQKQRQQRTQPSLIGFAPQETVRHHSVKLRRLQCPPTSHLPERPWVPRISRPAPPSGSEPPVSPTPHVSEQKLLTMVSPITVSLNDDTSNTDTEKPIHSGFYPGARRKSSANASDVIAQLPILQGPEREVFSRDPSRRSRRPILPTLERPTLAQPTLARSASAECLESSLVTATMTFAAPRSGKNALALRQVSSPQVLQRRASASGPSLGPDLPAAGAVRAKTPAPVLPGPVLRWEPTLAQDTDSFETFRGHVERGHSATSGLYAEEEIYGDVRPKTPFAEEKI